MRSSIATLLFIFSAGVLISTAQSQAGHVDLSITYDASRSSLTTGNSFWLQGGGIELAGILPHGLGVVGRVTGLHAGDISPSQVPLSLITVTFGPRYTWYVPSHLKKHRLSLFGQALAGEADAFGSVFPAPSNAGSSASSLALQIGGGADLNFSRCASIRLFQADWLRTQLPNGSTNIQNHLLVGGGITMHF